jgi:hypothetical protein
MTNRSLWFLLAILLTLGCNRCKDECDDPTDPACPNYDPCLSQTEVMAQIEIAEQAGIGPYHDIFETADIVMDKKNIRFRCPIEADSYTWHLGSEVIHAREFMRYFNGYAGQNIEVTLIIEKTPNLDCFPNDDGIDTLTKTFSITDACNPLIEGVYRGAWDAQPLDSFNVSIFKDFHEDYPEEGCYLTYMSNFSKNNPDSIQVHNDGWLTNYKLSVYTGLASLNSFRGIIELAPDQIHLKAEYTLYDSETQERTPSVYRGHRIY